MQPDALPNAGQGQPSRLDADLVIQRVRALGLDDHDLTRHVGLSLTDLERGPHPGAVTLDLLDRLSRLIDLHPIELITSTPPPTTSARDRTRPDTQPKAPTIDRGGDAGTVLAALVTAGPLNPDELATALGWSRRRLAAATIDLADQLTDQPLALVEDNHVDGTLALTVRPEARPASLRERLEAAGLARDGLDPREASSLLRLVREASEPVAERERRTADWKRFAPARRHSIHGHLARRGLAAPPPARGPVTPPVAHPDVLFALEVRVEPAAVSPTAPPRTRRGRPPP